MSSYDLELRKEDDPEYILSVKARCLRTHWSYVALYCYQGQEYTAYGTTRNEAVCNATNARNGIIVARATKRLTT